jgi:hypothetical protein
MTELIGQGGAALHSRIMLKHDRTPACGRSSVQGPGTPEDQEDIAQDGIEQAVTPVAIDRRKCDDIRVTGIPDRGDRSSGRRTDKAAKT